MGDIPREELLIETYQPHPPGGQHAGVRNGVKITHLPTGLIAICDYARSQHRNRAVAMDMILGGITSPGATP